MASRSASEIILANASGCTVDPKRQTERRGHACPNAVVLQPSQIDHLSSVEYGGDRSPPKPPANMTGDTTATLY